MAAFDKEEVKSVAAVSAEALPLTIICDNVRTPDNMGGILRVAAAVGAQKVILTKGQGYIFPPETVGSSLLGGLIFVFNPFYGVCTLFTLLI